MKKIIVLCFSLFSSAFSIKAMNVGLPSVRPSDIQGAVDYAFQEVQKCRNWPHNGKEKYTLFGIDDEVLLKHVANKQGKDVICIIDAGCANGAWGRKAMEILLNDETCKTSGKPFYIFSITGGKECENRVKAKGNVTLYQINSFKIENIDNEFILKNFAWLVGNVDLIVSSTTLRHLVDPFGTLIRMYNLLSPKSGLLVSDNFNFSDSKQSFVFPVDAFEQAEYGEPFAFTGASCLFYFNLLAGKNDFILMRTNVEALEVPLEYLGVVQIFKSSKSTAFNKQGFILGQMKRHVEPRGSGHLIFYYDTKHQNCVTLYHQLKQSGLI